MSNIDTKYLYIPHASEAEKQVLKVFPEAFFDLSACMERVRRLMIASSGLPNTTPLSWRAVADTADRFRLTEKIFVISEYLFDEHTAKNTAIWLPLSAPDLVGQAVRSGRGCWDVNDHARAAGIRIFEEPVIPMAAIAAHLCGEDGSLNPEVQMLVSMHKQAQRHVNFRAYGLQLPEAILPSITDGGFAARHAFYNANADLHKFAAIITKAYSTLMTSCIDDVDGAFPYTPITVE